jgi:Zn-dependent protease
MIQLLRYSDTVGPYFFMVLVIAITSCAIWLIGALRKNAMSRNDLFVKSSGGRYKKMIMH